MCRAAGNIAAKAARVVPSSVIVTAGSFWHKPTEVSVRCAKGPIAAFETQYRARNYGRGEVDTLRRLPGSAARPRCHALSAAGWPLSREIWAFDHSQDRITA